MKKIWDESIDTGRLMIAANAKDQSIRSFADLARDLDITEQALWNWKRRGIPSAKIFDLSDRYSCNPRWLATGKGSMKFIDASEYGVDLSSASFEKLEYIRDELIPMGDDEFRARKDLSESANRVAKIRERKIKDEGRHGD